MIPTAAPSGARAARQAAAAIRGNATPHNAAPANTKGSSPAHRPTPNATVRKRIGGRISGRLADQINCTGFAPQRGASPTLPNPSSSATSSLAFS